MEEKKIITNRYTDKAFITLHNKLVEKLEGEHNRQIDKWGVQTHTLFEWLGYTTEELGSLSKAISEFEYRGGSANQIVREAIQVATLSLKIAEMLGEK